MCLGGSAAGRAAAAGDPPVRQRVHGQAGEEQGGHDQARDQHAEGQRMPAYRQLPAGMSRSGPSRNPMYQSGTAPELMLPGWDGPTSHTGLICAIVPSRTSTAQGEQQQRIRPHPARPPQRRPEAEQEQRADQDREDEDVHPVVAADDLMPGGNTPKIQNTR